MLKLESTVRAGTVVELSGTLSGRGSVLVELDKLESGSQPRVHLAVRKPGSRCWQPLEFYRDSFFNEFGIQSDGSGQKDWIRSGSTRRASVPLPVGRWILRARCTETEDAFLDLEINAGRLTTVPITLVPRRE